MMPLKIVWKHYALIYPKQVPELVVVAAVPLILVLVRLQVDQQLVELDYRLNCLDFVVT